VELSEAGMNCITEQNDHYVLSDASFFKQTTWLPDIELSFFVLLWTQDRVYNFRNGDM